LCEYLYNKKTAFNVFINLASGELWE